ncbi:MAG: hypothetical protein NTX30_14610 [Deltaproteobacteria bacterium]|nr:hypothetical protein [Deltaproteobacteria bacterium]
MKRFLAPIVILSSLLFLMGMGELGGSAPADKVPSPEKNFSVKVTDREGIPTSLSQFSQEGKVFLAGKRGSATVTVPFEKISQIQFQAAEGNEIPAKLTLRTQESLDLKVDKRSKFYGKAEFGTFQIDAKDLKTVNFLP